MIPLATTRWLGIVLAAAALLAGRANAAEAWISMGPRLAVVRESVHLNVREGDHPLQLDDLPSEADASSLQVRFADPTVQVIDWRTRAPAVSAITARGPDAVWNPDAEKATGSASPVVEATVRAPRTGRQEAALIYSVTGLTWAAHYNVIVRGDLSRPDDRISVDIAGRVRVANRTARSWPGAHVLLVGEDRREGGTPRAPSGFLMLDDDPLSDLWRREPPVPAACFTYSLPDTVNVPAADSVEVEWFHVSRRPAERIYRLEPGVESTAGGSHALPLDRWLEVAPGRAEDSAALPPGEAAIFIGSQRASPERRAWFPHTPAGGRVRMNLGPEAAVTAERRRFGRASGQPGHYDETFGLSLNNGLDASVQVELLEQPPTELEWDVLNSTATHVREGSRLLLTLRLAPNSTQQVRYTLRIREPVF